MFTKVDIWTAGQTAKGYAILLRVPNTSQCLPVYVEAHDVMEILAAATNNRKKKHSYSDLIIAITTAISMTTESVEILKGGIDGQYRAIVNFASENAQFSFETQTAVALALAACTNASILIEDSILEEDSAGMIIDKSRVPIVRQIDYLKRELAEALQEENYEQAAVLRDKIAQIKETMIPESGE